MNYRKTVRRIIMAIGAFGILAIAIASCATSRVNASDEPAKHDIAFAEPKYSVIVPKQSDTLKTALMPLQHKQDQALAATGVVENKVDRLSQIWAGQLKGFADQQSANVLFSQLLTRATHKIDSLALDSKGLKQVILSQTDSISKFKKLWKQSEALRIRDREVDNARRDADSKIGTTAPDIVWIIFFAGAAIALLLDQWLLPLLKRKGIFY